MEIILIFERKIGCNYEDQQKDIANVLCVIFAIIIFATFLISIHLTVEYCKNESRNISQPPYKASPERTGEGNQRNRKDVRI